MSVNTKDPYERMQRAEALADLRYSQWEQSRDTIARLEDEVDRLRHAEPTYKEHKPDPGFVMTCDYPIKVELDGAPMTFACGFPAAYVVLLDKVLEPACPEHVHAHLAVGRGNVFTLTPYKGD
jgi:hypothetical protein